MQMLQVKDLRKEYRDVVAVQDVTFSVARGEIVGLLGPNGAGKTTTINMILGVLQPSAGSVTINGHDVATARRAALSSANFAAVYAQLPSNLTVRQGLNFFGHLYSVTDLKERVGTVLRDYELEEFADTKIGVLSSGESTRVALAKAMFNAPALLLLDEPTASLDPSTAREVRDRIRTYAKAGHGGILWTSHNMHEVVEVCDRVLFLSHGSILLEGDPKKLPAQHAKKDLEELFIAVAREPLSLSE